MADFSTALQKLEFEKIIRRISHLATTEPGKIICRQIVPLTDVFLIRLDLDRVTQMKELLIIEGSLPLDGLKDVVAILRKSGVENNLLTPLELLDVAAALRVSRTMAGFLSRRKDRIPTLHPLDKGLFIDKVVEFNIQDAIDETGRVRDSSSKELRMVRQDMADIAEQLKRKLGVIVRSVAEKELLQEDIITTRDGRFVIPVKSEYKNRVPGFIHSASASGATVFIEPEETLELNNGTLAYHLNVLEKEGIIRSVKDGKFRRFFPSEMKIPHNGELPTKVQRLILEMVLETPAIAQKEISRVLGLSQSTVSYHLDRLRELGLVRAERRGMQLCYFVLPDGIEIVTAIP